MLTGRRTFDGQTMSDAIARILEREPDWAALPRATPPPVRELLKRCLDKDPSGRPADLATVRAILDQARAPRARSARSRAMAAVGAAGLAGALALAALSWLRSDRLTPTGSSSWEQITSFPDSVTQPALSPDGSMLAFIRGEGWFATPGEVYLKRLPNGEPTPLTNDGLVKMDPVFSPDGNRLAYTVVGDRSLVFGWDTWVVPVLRGEPRSWLQNASGLTWVGPSQVLFSQIKSGQHMGIVTSADSRTDSRELYFPVHQSAMAHRSARSPDGQWVVIVEMDEVGRFTPCRLVPWAGGSSGRLVGPVPGRCTTAAWAPDGRWMYFTADTGEGFHVWRQRFPDGKPEQVTAGGTTEEIGLAVAADGRSLITSVGQQKRGVWIHDASGERQVSLEGYAFWPLFSANGRTLCFRVTRSPATGQTPSELWMTDLDSGRVERLLPGMMITQYRPLAGRPPGRVGPGGRRQGSIVARVARRARAAQASGQLRGNLATLRRKWRDLFPGDRPGFNGAVPHRRQGDDQGEDRFTADARVGPGLSRRFVGEHYPRRRRRRLADRRRVGCGGSSRRRGPSAVEPGWHAGAPAGPGWPGKRLRPRPHVRAAAHRGLDAATAATRGLQGPKPRSPWSQAWRFCPTATWRSAPRPASTRSRRNRHDAQSVSGTAALSIMRP